MHKCVLDFDFLRFIHIFLVVGNECLGNCLADSINLACLTPSTDSDTDIDIPELLLSGNQNRLHDFDSQRGWVDQVNWHSVAFDQPFAFVADHHGNGVLLFPKSHHLLLLPFCHAVTCLLLGDHF